MEPVRMALVGVGGIGGYHRKIMHEMEDIELVAAAEKFPDREKNIEHVEEIKSWGVPLYTDIWEMLDDVEVEAVTIATPHHFHGPYAIGCLERGLHVLVEKPVTVCIQDAYQMQRLAEANNLVVQVDFQYTGYPHSQKLKEIIVNGDLGELQSIVGVVGWWRTDEYYTRAYWAGKRFADGLPVYDGVLMNQAVHLLNTALQMGTRQDTHASPLTVQAEMYTVHDTLECEDLGCLRADLGEAQLNFYATTCVQDQERNRTDLDIYGTKGHAWWDTSKIVVEIDGKEPFTFEPECDRNAIYANFVAQVRGEPVKPYAPLGEALKATLTLNGAYASAGTIKKVGWDAVAGIADLLDTASAEHKLFSEVPGTEAWAYAGQVVDTSGLDSWHGLPEDLQQ